MLHLLSETCIYVPLPNECFCQIIGPHLIYMAAPKSLPSVEKMNVDAPRETDAPVVERPALKGKGEDAEPSARPTKRLKTANSVVSDVLLSKVPKKRAVKPKTWVWRFLKVL